MKKGYSLSALALSVFLAVGALSGCGQTGTPSGSSSSPSPSGGGQAATATPDTLEPVTLNYWIYNPAKQKDSDKVWAEFNKEIQKNLPNTTVEFTVITHSEYAEKWAKAMAAQESIDIAWLGWILTIADEVNKGSLMALDDLLDTYGTGIKDSLGETIIDIHRQQDGKIYQIPAWQGMVGNRSSFRFPKEIIDNTVGVSYIQELQDICYANYRIPTAEAKSKVYDKIEEYLAAIKDAGMLEKGYPPSVIDNWYLPKGITKISNFSYVAYDDATFTVKSYYESDLMKMHYGYMADWFQKGYIRSDAASLEKLAVTWSTDKTWKNGYILDAHNGFTDDVAKTESVRMGFDLYTAFTNPDCEYVLGTATGTGIPKTSKNPERAMMLMDLLVRDEGAKAYQTYVYGLEGEHWTDNGDGTVTTLGGSGQATADWPYGGLKWVLGTCLNSLVTQGDTAGYYEELKEQEASAYVPPLLAFKFDNSNVQTEQAQLQAVEKEYEDMLKRGYLGNNWETKYNEFVAKLKAAGLETFMAEVQRQVTDFVQKNNSEW